MSFVRKVFKELYGRIVKRRAQEFNIENRAYKLLDKGDLPRAPSYFTEQNALKKIFDENPHLKEEVKVKHEKLVDNMGQVKITVKYPPEPKRNKSKLPKDRQVIPKDTNFQVKDIPLGCIDFEIFLKIYDYKYNHLWSNEEIADEFDLNLQDVDDLLFYFKPFNNKIVDKKKFIGGADKTLDKSYVKIAQLLNKDVETFETIPLFKRELMRVKEENKKLEEVEEEEEFETEEQELERIKSLKFKEQKFYINRDENKTDDNPSEKNDAKTKDEKSKDDELKKDAKTV